MVILPLSDGFCYGRLCQEIPISPFKVKVDPSHDAGKVRAEGPGLNKTGEIPRTRISIRYLQQTL